MSKKLRLPIQITPTEISWQFSHVTTPSTDELDALSLSDDKDTYCENTDNKNTDLLIQMKFVLKITHYDFGCLEKVTKNKGNFLISIKEKIRMISIDKNRKILSNRVVNRLVNDEESYLSLSDSFLSQTTDIVSSRTESELRTTEDVLSSDGEQDDKNYIEGIDNSDIQPRESRAYSSNSQGSNSYTEQRSGGLIYDDPLHSKYESNSDKESSKQISIQTYNLDSPKCIKAEKKWINDKDNDNINFGFIGNNLLTHTLIIAFINSSKKIPTNR
ncbi:unnamed protein product [Dimorphilus gyrociliatus]|uniref:Uncharacterized protein n=1 Tax=Dimorphilus gyrociliatus TaxID=2664684 RepID=A0A7I8V9E6_9ANNE|nr:unnamed protein product [Dimorphilus gyrociliatus]